MSPTSLADRLLGIYLNISNARQSLDLILNRADPKDSQCKRVHDVVRIASEQTLKIAAEDIAEVIQDLKGYQYMQMKNMTSPDGAEGWIDKS